MQNMEIRIEGYIDKDWAEWLDDFTIIHTPENQTILSGAEEDQAALYGLITKLRDLGVKLISVNFIQESPKEPCNQPHRTRISALSD